MHGGALFLRVSVMRPFDGLWSSSVGSRRRELRLPGSPSVLRRVGLLGGPTHWDGRGRQARCWWDVGVGRSGVQALGA